MKRFHIGFTALLALLLLLCAACDRAGTTDPTPSAPATGGLARAFKSEEELQTAIAQGEIDLKEYYRPAYPPEGAVLDSIFLTDHTLVWQYYVGENAPENFYSLCWIRWLKDAGQYVEDSISAGEDAYQLMSIEAVSKQLNKELPEASAGALEAELSRYADVMRRLEAGDILICGLGPYYKAVSVPGGHFEGPVPVWLSRFSLDGAGFNSSIPYHLPERSLAFLFAPEKVVP